MLDVKQSSQSRSGKLGFVFNDMTGIDGWFFLVASAQTALAGNWQNLGLKPPTNSVLLGTKNLWCEYRARHAAEAKPTRAVARGPGLCGDRELWRQARAFEQRRRYVLLALSSLWGPRQTVASRTQPLINSGRGPRRASRDEDG
jgi:hypothetical protein